MSEHVCQSCGMPMTIEADFGTNKDGSTNGEYCVYCMQEGAFTSDLPLEEMVAEYANSQEELKDENGNAVTKEVFIAKTTAFLSNLKRWKTN